MALERRVQLRDAFLLTKPLVRWQDDSRSWDHVFDGTISIYSFFLICAVGLWVLRPLTGLLYQPRMVIVDKLVE
jgi:hypothetical protein